MRMHTAVGRLFTCLAAMLLIALPAASAYASDDTVISMTDRGATNTVSEDGIANAFGEVGDAVTADADRGTGPMTMSDPIDADADMVDEAATPALMLLEVPDEDPGSPTVAEREQTGPKTPDTSKEAISQAATHVATPERALTAKEATVAVGDPSASAGLMQTGDSLMEGIVVALGGVVIVVLCLLLYHFRKA